MAEFEKARDLLRAFKGDRYVHGMGVLWRTGEATAALGRSAALAQLHGLSFPARQGFLRTIREKALGSSRGVKSRRCGIWRSTIDGDRGSPFAPRRRQRRVPAGSRRS